RHGCRGAAALLAAVRGRPQGDPGGAEQGARRDPAHARGSELVELERRRVLATDLLTRAPGEPTQERVGSEFVAEAGHVRGVPAQAGHAELDSLAEVDEVRRLG